MAKPAKIHVEHPDVGTTLMVPVTDLAAATPADLVHYLTQQGALPVPITSRPYEVFTAGRALAMGRSFADNGLTGDATIQVLRATHGA